MSVPALASRLQRISSDRRLGDLPFTVARRYAEAAGGAGDAGDFETMGGSESVANILWLHAEASRSSLGRSHPFVGEFLLACSSTSTRAGPCAVARYRASVCRARLRLCPALWFAVAEE